MGSVVKDWFIFWGFVKGFWKFVCLFVWYFEKKEKKEKNGLVCKVVYKNVKRVFLVFVRVFCGFVVWKFGRMKELY